MSAESKKDKQVRRESQQADVDATTMPRDDTAFLDQAMDSNNASARGISRPVTRLAAAPPGDIGKVTVFLVGSLDMAPQLEQIAKINQGRGGATRTPMMTVIEAVLAHAGGSMNLKDLTAEVQRHWGRPFPGSPYSNEEFVYMMASKSDRVRIGP